MGYFEFHHESRTDPRIDKLSRSLRLRKAYALGHLSMLRAWASSEPVRAFTGDLSAFTPETLAEASDWPSEPTLWIQALMDSELLSRDPDAPPLKVGEILGGHSMLADWIDICGEATRKKIERRTSSAVQQTNGADPLESFLLSFSNVRTSNPTFSLFMVMKYVKKGKDKTAVKEDKRWDVLNKDRQLPWCKKILESYEGDLNKAGKAMISIGQYFENLGLSWDASTVHKRLTDWEEGRLGR